jgi:hypothetical protein
MRMLVGKFVTNRVNLARDSGINGHIPRSCVPQPPTKISQTFLARLTSRIFGYTLKMDSQKTEYIVGQVK